MILHEIVLALIAGAVIDLALDMTGPLNRWLIRIAARRLPEDLRERCIEEWQESIESRPRLLRPFYALDLFRAAIIVNRERRLAAGTAQLTSFENRVRRLVDIAVASLVLLIASPIFIAIYLVLRITARAPVIVPHLRWTVAGRPVHILKFRTHHMARVADSWVECEESAFGGFLNRTYLDGLPQLFNVMGGSMTLVGPRPSLPLVFDAGDPSTPRSDVTPGLTGLAYVRDQMRQPRDPNERHARVRTDLEYLARRTVLSDLKLFALTVGMCIARLLLGARWFERRRAQRSSRFDKR